MGLVGMAMALLAVEARCVVVGRAHLVRGVLALAVAPPPSTDCLATALGARGKIAATLEEFEATGNPSGLRPAAKALLNGPLRACLETAARTETPAGDHARSALEYIASVVEFDAFDKLSKPYEPKASQAYTPAKLDYSKRAFSAADRELGLFIFTSGGPPR